MLRHAEQWRFGVFWQDASDGTSDGTDGQGGGGFGGLGGPAAPAPGTPGSTATVDGQAVSFPGFSTAPGPSGTNGATAGPSGIGAPSGRGGGPAAAPSGGGAGAGVGGGAATGGGAGPGGAATGGGGGTAAGGSASGPGGAGSGGLAGGGAGGTSIGDIAAGFFSSIMGSPANAKSLYGDPGSAAAYMNPQQKQAINQQLQIGQPNSPAFGNIGVQSLIDALSGNALGGGLGNVAQQTPSPTLGSLALAIALGDTFGALGGQAPGGATPGYGDQATMGYPALEGVSPGLTAAPAGPSPGTPFGGAISAPSVRGPGSDATAPVSTYGDLGGGPAGQNTTGMPTGPGGAEVGGGMPTGLDFGPGVGPASDITSPGFGAPVGDPGAPGSSAVGTPPSPSQAPGTIGVPGTTPTPTAVTSNTPSAVAATVANAPSPTAAAQSVAQAIAYQSPDQQSQTITQALDAAQQTLTPAAYEQFVGELLRQMDPVGSS